MTSKTEELKREMYTKLRHCRVCGEQHLQAFEDSLEAYLEALRQDLKTSHTATGEVAIQLQEMKTERDELRNKLQAFQFANQSAGELLRDAMATVKRQREFIRTLYASRKARKPKVSTSARNSNENASSASGEGNALMIVLGAMIDAQRIMVDWLIPDGIGAKKAMARMTEVLDNEPLCLALKVFEKSDEVKS